MTDLFLGIRIWGMQLYFKGWHFLTVTTSHTTRHLETAAWICGLGSVSAAEATVGFHCRVAKHGRTNGERSFHHERLGPETLLACVGQTLDGTQGGLSNHKLVFYSVSGSFEASSSFEKRLNFSAKEQISSTPRLSYESQGRLFRGSWVMVEFWDVLILSHTISYYLILSTTIYYYLLQGMLPSSCVTKSRHRKSQHVLRIWVVFHCKQLSSVLNLAESSRSGSSIKHAKYDITIPSHHITSLSLAPSLVYLLSRVVSTGDDFAAFSGRGLTILQDSAAPKRYWNHPGSPELHGHPGNFTYLLDLRCKWLRISALAQWHIRHIPCSPSLPKPGTR